MHGGTGHPKRAGHGAGSRPAGTFVPLRGNPARRATDQAYLNCLHDHGVTPGPGMNTADPATVKAMAICGVLRPSASPTPSD